MKKKIITFVLAAIMTCTLMLPSFSVALAKNSGVEQTIRALGIITGDATGNLNLSSPVTRAEFAKMMVAASIYKDTIGQGYGYSLFKDVKSTHWASAYIKLAIDKGWVTGYVDGTYRPDNTITLEEACTALLRMLGYNSSNMAGSFPTAQLSKSQAIGLLESMDAVRGQTLTRNDCMTLFYNLLMSESSSGVIYATTLGYKVTNGKVDYSTVVTAGTKGPYVSTDGTMNLPFSSTNAIIYLNGEVSSVSKVHKYDVYYYNSNMHTAWAYNKRIAGTLSAVSPSQAAPTSVTVSGNSYTIGTTDAAFKLSSQGNFRQGDIVTLLLGMNDDVVDVLSAAESNSTYYGIVVSSVSEADSTETAKVQYAVKVACTDGIIRTFNSINSDPTKGSVVSVIIDKVGVTIRYLSIKSVAGTVSQDGKRLGEYRLADDVEILDTDSDGGYVRIYPSRIAGVTVDTDDVIYYTLDQNGAINKLILKEVTGDTASYGFLTSVTEISGTASISLSGTYRYLMDGTAKILTTDNVLYHVSVGAAAFRNDDKGSVKSIRNLSSISLSELNDLYAMSSNMKYLLSDNVQVLLNKSGDYYATTLSAVNAKDYYLTGWYDNFGYTAGCRIRYIVAAEK